MAGKKGTGFFNVIGSALSAAFGVQKRDRLERDFQEGKPAHFIIAGITGTIVFILVLVLAVNLVLKAAAS